MSRDYGLKRFEAPVELRIQYDRELNPEQLAAVTAPDGPALVIAGAGSGKTRTLTYRVAWLIEHGVPADRILLLTFTNKAAKEMMSRVTDLLGGGVSNLAGGTFHSVGQRILRRHADRLGYRPDFTIADREDAQDLIEACIEDAGIKVTETRFPSGEVLADMFSMAVNRRVPLEKTIAERYEYFSGLTPEITRVAKAYAERKRVTGLMDFDDLLVLWLRLVEEQDAVGDALRRRFRYLLVDEYQDTNQIQGDLIDRLSELHHNVMAVGDDSQSIYSWRGAEFRNILEFPKRHPDAKVYRIETNYRSTPEILALANAAIQGNTMQFPKELRPIRKSGTKPALVPCTDAGEQSAFVAQRVLELRDEGIPLNEMAVLYRSHYHAMELQMELARRNIPFQITSGIRFFEQAHIKDVAAYLKLLTNPADELAFKRLARMLPGIGGKGADKLWHLFAAQLGEALAFLPPPIAQAAQPSDEDGGAPPPETGPRVAVAPLLSAIAGQVPKKTAAMWAQFTATIAQCEDEKLRNLPSEVIRLLVEAVYRDYAEATFDNPQARLEDIEQLAVFAQQFHSAVELLTQLALMTNMDGEGGGAASRRTEDEEQLRLSTIHQAKGLEYSVVFVIMLCDGLFPTARSLDSTQAGEEERRLFYVAVTRARNELYLTYPLLRFMRGGGDAMQIPSRFLDELPKDVFEQWNLRPAGGLARPWDGGSSRRGLEEGADEPF